MTAQALPPDAALPFAGAPPSPLPSSAAPAAPACAHCGLPVPAALVLAGAPRQFCCAGCRAVHDLLSGAGLERYYDLRARFEAEAGPSAAALPTTGAHGRSYAVYDDPAFQARHLRRAPSGGAEIDLALESIRCVACVWLLERLPRIVPGALRAEVDPARGLLRLAFDPARRPLSEIAAAIDALGYPVHPWRGARRAEARRAEDRAMLIRLAAAGAAAGNVMLLSVALYAGVFGDALPGDIALFRWTSLAITVPAVLGAGSIFFRGALAALRAGALHLDLPIAIGLAAGLLWGAANTALGRGEVWFDSLAVLTFLLLVGRYLVQKGRRRAVDATEMLGSLTPLSAQRLEEGGVFREVPIEALAPGDVVLVRAGDAVPADGVVLEGRSALDQAFLTGEARPVPCAPGDRAPAGAVNLDAPLRVRAERTGEETRAGRIARMVGDLASRRAPIVQLVDRISGRFVAAVLGLAAATLAFWALARGAPSEGLENALALLVVTCPCALGMATPLAIHAALGRAAAHGTYVRGGDVVEKLGALRGGRIFVDKTGTLTEGRARLLSWIGDPSLLGRAAALEATSAHPLARALVAASDERGEPRLGLEVRDVREVAGGGIEGTVEGRRLLVGAPAFVRARAGCPPSLEAALAAILAEGRTPALVAEEGAVRAVLGFGDAVRREAAETVAALRARGLAVTLLSGDDPAVVRRVAADVGIAAEDAIGGASPERKAALVAAALEEARARGGGPVIMVGDGVNDAPSFAAASVGIAVHGAAEAGLAAADAFLTRPGLGAVVGLLDGARRTLCVVRRNLAFSLVYNAVGATLAVMGLLHPLVGAVLMPASSLTVVASSYRARTFPAPASAGPGGRPWT